MVTLREIAERSEQSIATVNAVLNDKADQLRISKATQAKVRDMADLLGYAGNYHARTLSTGQSRTLGFIFSISDTPTMTYQFYRELIAGAERRASALGYSILLIGNPESGNLFEAAMDMLDTRRVDALVTFGQLLKENEHLRKLNPDWPIVTLGVRLDLPYSNVELDAEPGMCEALKTAYDLGHRNMLYLGKTYDGEIRNSERITAAKQYGKKLGITMRTVCLEHRETSVHVDDEIAYYRDQISDVAAMPRDDETLVFAYNDLVAMAACSMLMDDGKKIGSEVSVIGFDDLFGSSFWPPLSSVSHALHEMAATAVELAVGRIEGKIMTVEHRRVPAVFVQRMSLGKPNM